MMTGQQYGDARESGCMAAEYGATKEVRCCECEERGQDVQQKIERCEGQNVKERGEEPEKIAGVKRQGLADHVVIGEEGGIGPVFEEGDLNGLVADAEFIAGPGDLRDGEEEAECEAKGCGDGASQGGGAGVVVRSGVVLVVMVGRPVGACLFVLSLCSGDSLRSPVAISRAPLGQF